LSDVQCLGDAAIHFYLLAMGSPINKQIGNGIPEGDPGRHIESFRKHIGNDRLLAGIFLSDPDGEGKDDHADGKEDEGGAGHVRQGAQLKINEIEKKIVETCFYLRGPAWIRAGVDVQFPISLA
jgi:hypothetical protein